MGKPTILVIEDDESLAEVLVYNLEQAGYEVSLALDGREGLTRARRDHPEVVLLDLMLPFIDGHEICRRLRSEPETGGTLIVMLTAKAEESDQLIGFSLGADDYVTKPFSVKVLVERIKALWRRGREVSDDARNQASSQGITVDRRSHRVTCDGQPVKLTRSEFRLLDTLVRQPGRVFRRGELIDAVLGEDTIVLERTIDVHVRALRQKLGDRASLVETVRGVGYRFRDPASPGDEA